ncbi:hypothetical protein BDV12DRAFT_45090 [Aspergillus spectabilis]
MYTSHPIPFRQPPKPQISILNRPKYPEVPPAPAVKIISLKSLKPPLSNRLRCPFVPLRNFTTNTSTTTRPRIESAIYAHLTRTFSLPRTQASTNSSCGT